MAEEIKNLTPRGNRKERVGEVVSNKMAKTIVVRVERRFPHPRFKKIVTAYKKFYAHDEKAEAKKLTLRHHRATNRDQIAGFGRAIRYPDRVY